MHTNTTITVNDVITGDADEELSGPELLAHRMANAWKANDGDSHGDIAGNDKATPDESGPDVAVADALDSNEIELSGPDLLAYRMANAWHSPGK